MADKVLCDACRTIPAVVVDEYKEKGAWVTLGDYKTYITGNTDATTAILYVYDAFGYTSQTLQGADILAAGTGALVVMPDFMHGGYLDLSVIPPDTPEKKAALEAFATGAGEIPSKIASITSFAENIPTFYPSVKKQGTIGFCWGGKIVALTSGKGTPFAGSVQCHPGRMTREDVEKIAIPHLVLASKDEDATIVGEYKEVLEARKDGKSEVETYAEMHHGWMGGRARLQEEHFKNEYLRGYTKCAEWFTSILA